MQDGVKSPETSSAPMFYIQDTRTNGHDGSVLWWGHDSRGYTSDLNRAGLYSADEAARIERNRRTDKAWPRDMVDLLSSTRRTLAPSALADALPAPQALLYRNPGEGL